MGYSAQEKDGDFSATTEENDNLSACTTNTMNTVNAGNLNSGNTGNVVISATNNDKFPEIPAERLNELNEFDSDKKINT